MMMMMMMMLMMMTMMITMTTLTHEVLGAGRVAVLDEAGLKGERRNNERRREREGSKEK